MYPSLGVVRAGLEKTGAVQRFCKRVGRSYLGKMPIHVKLDAGIKAEVKKEVKTNVYASTAQVVEPIFSRNFEINPVRQLAIIENVNRVARKAKANSFPKNPFNMNFNWIRSNLQGGQIYKRGVPRNRFPSLNAGRKNSQEIRQYYG